jgi:hypothetical protein
MSIGHYEFWSGKKSFWENLIWHFIAKRTCAGRKVGGMKILGMKNYAAGKGLMPRAAPAASTPTARTFAVAIKLHIGGAGAEAKYSLWSVLCSCHTTCAYRFDQLSRPRIRTSRFFLLHTRRHYLTCHRERCFPFVLWR